MVVVLASNFFPVCTLLFKTFFCALATIAEFAQMWQVICGSGTRAGNNRGLLHAMNPPDTQAPSGEGAKPEDTIWLIEPEKAHRGLLVYVHGGSFLFGASPLVIKLVTALAQAANMALVMPGYRLAPEHPCPAAIEDVTAFLNTLEPQGYALARTIVVAEQAGANLALAAVQAQRRAQASLPAAMIFFSPWLDLSLSSWNALLNRLGMAHAHSGELIGLVTRLYLGEGPGAVAADDALASPLLGDLCGLPPVLIHASESDISIDDSRRLSDQMEGGGQPAALHIWPRVEQMWARYELPYCTQSITKCCAFADRLLAG